MLVHSQPDKTTPHREQDSGRDTENTSQLIVEAARARLQGALRDIRDTSNVHRREAVKTIARLVKEYPHLVTSCLVEKLACMAGNECDSSTPNIQPLLDELAQAPVATETVINLTKRVLTNQPSAIDARFALRAILADNHERAEEAMTVAIMGAGDSSPETRLRAFGLIEHIVGLHLSLPGMALEVAEAGMRDPDPRIQETAWRVQGRIERLASQWNIELPGRDPAERQCKKT